MMDYLENEIGNGSGIGGRAAVVWQVVSASVMGGQRWRGDGSEGWEYWCYSLGGGSSLVGIGAGGGGSGAGDEDDVLTYLSAK